MAQSPYNTALAYDFDAAPAYAPAPARREAPAVAERPRFDVYTGEGRAADQEVSPVFMSVLRVCAVLVATVVIIGFARVSIATFTTAALNANAELETALEEAETEAKELEVMRTVYGSETRIRDLATGYGMVESGDTVTLDFTADAQAASAAAAGAEASAQ